MNLHVLFIIGCFPAFIPVAETECDPIQITSPCSATAGGSVNIKLMTNVSSYRVFCKKVSPSGATTVFTLKKGKVNIGETFRNRTEFFTDLGTLKITKVERNDSGQYDVEIFDVNGIKVKMLSFNLEVEGKYSFIYFHLSTYSSSYGLLLFCQN